MIPKNIPGQIPSYPSFLVSELGYVKPDQALFHVIPVPYEKTVTYGTGTAGGPSAILTASQQLELYDGFGIPAEKGIYTEAPHHCRGLPEPVLESLATRVAAVVAKKKIPVVLGGEHTVTAGALMGITRVLGPVGVIQFDAHADLRDRYEGSRFNHACAMHRVLDQGHRLFQMGVRSLSLEEVRYRRDQAIGHVDAADIHRGGIPEIILPEDFPQDIYITIDVDCLDPSLMPSTGTPEPGGLTWYQMTDALEGICRGRRVSGFDMVELAPIPGFHAPDFTIAKLIYQVMGVISRNT
jgi:N1-aminopropylagmatine ureohydrolase